MNFRARSHPLAALAVGLVIVPFLSIHTRAQDANRQPDAAGQIPPVVVDALKARFPKAEIEKWTREKEGEIVLYDIEFQQDGVKFEADITDTGRIDNWERQIPPTDLPEPVRRTVEQRYPNAQIREVMQITLVKAGVDVLEGYEVVLQTQDKKEAEVSVSPDGKVLEDSGQASE
jgi:hypothetical protein